MCIRRYMGRCHLLFPCLAAWAIIAGRAPAQTAPIQAGEKPNIVFILADDLGVGDVGAYNSESKIPTANIDRLAEQGMRFTDAHSAGALCHTSRFGLLTGRYPFRGDPGAWRNRPVIEEGCVTLSSFLRDHGYTTAMVGKWHLGFETKPSDFSHDDVLRGGPVDRGFDYYYGEHASLDIPPYFYIENDQPVAAPSRRVEAHHPPEDSHWHRLQGAYWQAGGIAPGFHYEGVLPRWREKSIAFLERHHRQNPEKPFFVYLALTAPHTPWMPLEKFRGKTGAGRYGDFVVQTDDLVGEVLSTLKRLGYEENTLVIFTSDNGPFWFPQNKERFNHRSAGIYRGMKGDIWEGGHRIPFIARWPGHIPAAAVSDQLLCHTDMMATFAAILGVQLPQEAGADSFNMLPALRNSNHEAPIRKSMVQEAWVYEALRQGDWKLIPGLGGGGFSKPRTREPVAGGPQGQLYNLADDPREQNNLWQERPEKVEKLKNLLAKHKKQDQTRPIEQ